MSRASFPALLKCEATLMSNFTRLDLVLLGMTYLILSWMKVAGVVALLINVCVYLTFKKLIQYLPRGFFQNLSNRKTLHWSYRIKGIK